MNKQEIAVLGEIVEGFKISAEFIEKEIKAENVSPKSIFSMGDPKEEIDELTATLREVIQLDAVAIKEIEVPSGDLSMLITLKDIEDSWDYGVFFKEDKIGIISDEDSSLHDIPTLFERNHITIHDGWKFKKKPKK